MYAEPKTEVRVWGHPWFGLICLRVFTDEVDYKTFWHVALWEFTFGVSFPAFIVRMIENVQARIL
jgi:hypothetical protein